MRLEDLQADEGASASAAQRQDRPFRKPQRKPLPPHLPRHEQIHVPDETACPSCGGTLAQLGEDVSEQLEYVPASFRVIRHVRPKLACACCDCIVQAAAASRPIERGLPGPGLLAHVLVAKFADHLPLVRLAKSLFQLFKEYSLWKLPSEPSVPSEVAYLDVRDG